LEGLARQLGIQGQVDFVGSKAAGEIAALFQGCEVFVLPSRVEPFGIVIIEAMACKKPVVATAVDGIPEIIEHGKTGMLVESGNPDALRQALQGVLSNPDLRNALAENGYSRVMERFCLNHTGAAYESAYASVLGFQRA
jgi:glycosyltransferase involved in cell wall biosynthesis